MVGELEQVEALCDGEQPSRLRCRITVVRDVRAVDDASEQDERRRVESVLLDQHLEGAEAVTVVEPRAAGVVRERVLALGDVENVRSARRGTRRRDR